MDNEQNESAANQTPDKSRYDEATGQYTTGHKWDGIEELNTPMPRWWLGIFYASIAFAIVYVILMPAIPLLNGYTTGLLGKSDRAEVAQSLEVMRGDRSEYAAKLEGASLETIAADPELFRFAMAAGKSAFGDNCATCHGSGGQGFKGYPNLNDDVWIWGGTFDDILLTLQVGIRAAHEDTRTNLMSAYGRDGFLTREEIYDVVDYLASYQKHEDAEHDVSAETIAKGRAHFEENCTSCHGNDAKGDQTQGAPDLTDTDWLYGGTRQDIFDTLWGGRQGVMPNWDERLDPSTVTALAVYVHSFGGGEATPDPILSVPSQELEAP